jgi:hypothetical protein
LCSVQTIKRAAIASQAKKTNDQLRAALRAKERTPMMRRKLENTHSCGKTALKLIRRMFR